MFESNDRQFFNLEIDKALSTSQILTQIYYILIYPFISYAIYVFLLYWRTFFTVMLALQITTVICFSMRIRKGNKFRTK